MLVVMQQGATDLTIVANNAGAGRVGLAKLMEAGRVRKIICSFPRSSDPVVFAAARRAIDAVHRGAPYGAPYRGQSFALNFDAKKACSQG